MRALEGPIVVTGGLGFIGSHLLAALSGHRVCVVDKRTYSANKPSDDFFDAANFELLEADISTPGIMADVITRYKPKTVFHLAAESHVDRSIASPDAFLSSNIAGTYQLLEAIRAQPDFEDVLLVHVSTDEVFGDLPATGYFTEESHYQPSSPYSASKAASDHLVRAWARTYNLRAIVSHCSNNFGPRQHPEKLIPKVIRSALTGKLIPIYGDGSNRRDWLYVEDHVAALLAMAERGTAGESYCVGGGREISNLELAHRLVAILDDLRPLNDGLSYGKQISFVTDRPGHDFRYAINAEKVRSDLGWKPSDNFDALLEVTVKSYVEGNYGW